MSNSRTHTLVVDFSVMPSRPDPSAAEDFVLKKLKLELKEASVIQFHNVDRRFYIQMMDDEKPLQYQRAHNLQHKMLCAENKREYRIPVYYLDGACTVRIHDLPPSLPNATVKDHMQQYGNVINIAFERWKNYFGGAYNGVRVLRMHLNKPIPSYLTIDKNLTLCTHSPFGNQAQIKTCKYCDLPLHPNTKCGKQQQAAVDWSKNAASSSSSSSTNTSLSPENFPALESTQTPRGHHGNADQQAQKASSTSTPPTPQNDKMELEEHNGSGSKSEGLSVCTLDQQAVFEKIMESDRLSYSDPEERRRHAWIAAGSFVENNKRILAEQNRQQKKK